MKKNITINLCGRLYQIDEDAYELLSHYIDTLRAYFQKQEGGQEIADDIEERIAELFDELKSQGTQAITIEHVQDIIQRIGQVNDIAGEEDTESTKNTENTERTASGEEKEKNTLNSKKFFRDSQNKMLAGVLAGCAQYYGGSANSWRWGYVIACLLWCFLMGSGPASLTAIDAPLVGAFFGLLAVPVFLMSLPVILLPALPYLLVAVFTPETKTPEDVLRMKGKEVNPQNLTEEVKEAGTMKKKAGNSAAFWDIFVGIVSIGVSTFLTIGFIVALCFFTAFVAASELMAETWWQIDETSILNAITLPVTLCGILLLASIAILLYCSVHSATSSFGKTPAMSTRQRIIWFLLWVASLAGFVGSMVYAVSRYQKAIHASWELRYEVQEEEENDALPCDTIDLDSDAVAIPADTLPTAEQ